MSEQFKEVKQVFKKAWFIDWLSSLTKAIMIGSNKWNEFLRKLTSLSESTSKKWNKFLRKLNLLIVWLNEQFKEAKQVLEKA